MERSDRLSASEEKLLADLLAERSKRIRPNRAFQYLLRQRVRQWARGEGEHVPTKQVSGRLLSFTRIWVGATCSFLLVVMGLVSYSYASPFVGRDSSLYFIKRFVESVELKSARSPGREAETYLKFSERRADEANVLSEEGVIDIPTIREMTRNLLRATTRTKMLPPSEQRASLERRLEKQLNRGEEDLSRMLKETEQKSTVEQESRRQRPENIPLPAVSPPPPPESAPAPPSLGVPSPAGKAITPASASGSAISVPEKGDNAQFLRQQLKQLQKMEEGVAPASAPVSSGAAVPGFRPKPAEMK